ncbi:hypothetical protein QTP88_021534 [Uroleucon formosanum]
MVTTNSNVNVFIKQNKSEHHHETNEINPELKEIRCAIKRKSQMDLNKKPLKIIRQELCTSSVSADNIDAMRQSMYRERRKLLPPVPVSLSDALNKIKESNITLNNGEQFVFVNESAKIIIVTCKTNLQFLCNEIEFILADGTFTYCSKHFYQQYTIHGVCKQYYVPLVFCFLPSKTKDIYKQMWETLKDLCLNNANSVFQPSLLLLDFELSAHIAVKEVFPLIIIKACRFHLGQAWYRKISSIPILKKNYNDKNSQSGLWLKLFFGLPYLPSHMISEAFIEIMATCPDEKQYYDFADYILDNYIETNHFSPILWAEEPNKSTRTTNGAESYHSQLRHEFYVPHPTIFHSINVLKQQQIISETKFRLIRNGNVNRTRKVCREKEKSILNVYDRFINNEISLIDYLKTLGCQRFQVSQHISTTKHKQNKERQNKFKQQFLTSSPSTSSDDNSSTFYTDLCRTFIRADIPIFKLKNPALKDFLEQYTGKTIPEESTIRKKYVNVIYEETLTSIRQNIQDGPIWVSIDESTDADGRYVGNVIVGKLSSEPCNSFLLNCVQLDKCNHKTIAKLFNDSMNLLWPEGVKYENVFLFLSDAAPYMCKAGNVLNAFFPKLIHVTCLAHGFHRVAETIRSSYPDVDQLIATVKKIFLKAPSRVLKFKELYPDLNLPPEPILTRWGTWLEAALYYCEHFEKIKNIISSLNTETATASYR